MSIDGLLPKLGEIRSMNQEGLHDLVASSLDRFGEDEAIAVLSNRYCTAQICQRIAQSPKLTSYYDVRKRLVAHRQTPQTFAMKFVHYLYRVDLVKLSTDVHVPAPVRRAIDQQMIGRLTSMALGEKVATARVCSRELASVLLRDPDAKVFAALLANPRIQEDELVAKINSGTMTPDQIRILASDRKWSFRQPIRIALVLNPATPRAIAASQLRFLSKLDLRRLHSNPALSLYLKRCIERFSGEQPTESEILPA